MKNMNQKFLTAILLASTAAAGNTFAEGNGVSGGGDAILCGSKVELADLWEYKIKSNPRIQWFHSSPFTAEILTEAMAEMVQNSYPEVGLKLKKSLDQLVFQEVNHLEELEDDNIDPRLLKRMGCQKKQLAVQNLKPIKQKSIFGKVITKFPDGTKKVELKNKKNPDGLARHVRVNKEIYNKLDVTNKALLKVHEALIASFTSYQDTTPIRKLLAEKIHSPSFIKMAMLYAIEDSQNNHVVSKVTELDEMALIVAISQVGKTKDKENIYFESAPLNEARLLIEEGSSYAQLLNGTFYIGLNSSTSSEENIYYARPSAEGVDEGIEYTNSKGDVVTANLVQLKATIQTISKEYAAVLTRMACTKGHNSKDIEEFMLNYLNDSSDKKSLDFSRDLYSNFCN